MQIDFNNSVGDLWNWTTNVADGQSLVSSNAASGQTWWTNQVNAWNAYNAAHPSKPIPAVYNATEGPCEFSMNPTGSMHPYNDAVAIKAYNSGPPSNGSAYITFTSSGWSINDLSGSVDYVFRVCTTNP